MKERSMDWKTTCRVFAGSIAVAGIGYLACTQIDWNHSPFAGMTSGSAASTQSVQGEASAQDVPQTDSATAEHDIFDNLDSDDLAAGSAAFASGSAAFVTTSGDQNNNVNVGAMYGMVETTDQSVPDVTTGYEHYGSIKGGSIKDGSTNDDSNADGFKSNQMLLDSQDVNATIFSSGDSELTLLSDNDLDSADGTRLAIVNTGKPGAATSSQEFSAGRGQHQSNPFMDEPLPKASADLPVQSLQVQNQYGQNQFSQNQFSQDVPTETQAASQFNSMQVGGIDNAPDALPHAAAIGTGPTEVSAGVATNTTHPNATQPIAASVFTAPHQSSQMSSQQSGRMENRTTSLPPTNAITPGGASSYRVPDSVAQKAAHHIEYGKSLARRGASQSARQEFYHGLRLIAQAMDAGTGSNYHTSCLKRAITTLREAGEFHVGDSETQMVDNIAPIVDAHTSDVVSMEQAERMTSIEALQRYYAAAQHDFEIASGNNVVSGEALYCLGKLHSSMSRHESSAEPLDVAKSILYHRTAVTCDSRNYRSANELGAMLSRNGQADEAIGLFKQSLRVKQTSQAWNNLATVHQRMGQSELAMRAGGEAERMANLGGLLPVQSGVEWLDATQFNARAPKGFQNGTMARVPTPAPTAVPDEPRFSQAPEKESLLDKINPFR